MNGNGSLFCFKNELIKAFLSNTEVSLVHHFLYLHDEPKFLLCFYILLFSRFTIIEMKKIDSFLQLPNHKRNFFLRNNFSHFFFIIH